MKKLYVFLFSVLTCTTVFGQVDETFQFTDAEGNVIPDGTVINITEPNEEGQLVVPLFVKNMSGQKAAVSMFETIDQKPNGDWQTCAFGNCMILQKTGYSPKNIMSDDYFADIETEWIPEEGAYSSWTATLQIHVFNITQKFQFGQTLETAGDNIIGYGPTVTVNFIYADPSGISSAEKSPSAVVSCYSLDSRRASTARRPGLYVFRMQDGSTIKRIVK